MLNKKVKKTILLLTICFLLIGIVSATNSTDTITKTKNVKEIQKKINEKEITKTIPEKKETKKITTLDNKKIKVNSNKTKNPKTATVQNIYVSSKGTGNGKTSSNPTNITTALSNINNKGIINLVTTSKSDTYSVNLNINTTNVKEGTTDFSIIGQKNKDITIKGKINVSDVSLSLSNLKFTGKDTRIISKKTANLNVKNCTFKSITQKNDDLLGGTIVNNGSKLIVKNCVFASNKIDYKLPDYFGDTSVPDDIELYGVAICNYGNNAIISGNLFQNNEIITQRDIDYKKYAYGGAVYNYGDHVTITNNTFIGNRADNGGALFNYGYYTTINKNIFKNNKAKFGGALYDAGQNNKVTENIFTKNYASEFAGAIRSNGKDNTINNNTFINNTAPDSSIIYTTDNKLTFKNNIIKQNPVTNKSCTQIDLGSQTSFISKNNKIYYEKDILNIINLNIAVDSILNNTYLLGYDYEKKPKTSITIKFDNTNPYINSKVKITTTLKDSKKKAIKNQAITLKIGSKKYNLKTNSKGIATKTIKITKTGKIKVNAEFEETIKYHESSKNSTITAKTKEKTTINIKFNKKSVVEKNTIKATITLKNKKSKAIKNAKIILKAGNKKYNLKTNNKGQAHAKIKINSANDKIDIKYNGNEQYKIAKLNNKISKYVKIIPLEDLTFKKDMKKIKVEIQSEYNELEKIYHSNSLSKLKNRQQMNSKKIDKTDQKLRTLNKTIKNSVRRKYLSLILKRQSLIDDYDECLYYLTTYSGSSDSFTINMMYQFEKMIQKEKIPGILKLNKQIASFEKKYSKIV
ncbi:MAG: hypothetical protein IJJ47_04560 [Methanosphaera sp.]|nr:hypothetical protein [Methanosphaera sp.]